MDISAAALGVILSVVILLIFKERVRRTIQGYYVYMRGGVDGGDVRYNESGKEISLYYTRRNRTIYVPSHTNWNEIMPDWAKGKRDFIISRIRERVSSTWKFEDATDKERMRAQNR
jgi:hypothetical protein